MSDVKQNVVNLIYPDGGAKVLFPLIWHILEFLYYIMMFMMKNSYKISFYGRLVAYTTGNGAF